MGLSETQDILPGAAEEASQNDGAKLVPIAESIRYRKRAQSAEKKVASLTEQLAEAESQVASMSVQLDDIREEQRLTRKLAWAGVVDMEAATLIAKARMKADAGVDVDRVVDQLKKDKQYLFAASHKSVTTPKTAGAKERTQNGQMILAKVAKKAATTGNRADLQEYLRLRRNLL